MQRQEKSTPYRSQPPHITGTKRSLYRDLEKQFEASRRIADVDASGTIAQENEDPISSSSQSKPCGLSSAESVVEPFGMKSGQVSVIRKAPSAIPPEDNTTPLKRSGYLAEVTRSQLAAGSCICASPDKLQRKDAEQQARYVSALALIQLAHGNS